MKKKILLVEDDPILNSNIKDALKSENMEVVNVTDGKTADNILKEEQFDCVILDINLPEMSGFDVCKNFRESNKETPIIMLTAFAELDDKVRGYECGADDYLTKPFYMKELVLRIQSLQKRRHLKGKNKEEEIWILADLKVYPKIKKVEREGKEIELTPREFQILVKLIEANGELVLKKDLIKEIWGKSFDANTNTIEVYINFLRNKIDKPYGSKFIKTKVGYGYYIDTK